MSQRNKDKVSLSFARIINDLEKSIKTQEMRLEKDKRSLMFKAMFISRDKEEKEKEELEKSKEEIFLLKQLRTDLMAFESVQTNWSLESGILAQHEKDQQVKLSQKALNREAAQSTLDSAKLTTHMAEVIISHIDPKHGAAIKPDGTAQSQYEGLKKNHGALLKDIIECSLAVKEYSEKVAQDGEFLESTLTEEKAHIRANNLNAVYIPSRQGLDPIHGRVFDKSKKAITDRKGYCFGHSIVYCKTVSKTGRYLAMPRLDARTLRKQEDQRSFRKKYESSTKQYPCREVSFLNIYKIMEKSLSEASEKNVYTFAFSLKKGNPGHAMAFRKFSTGEVEFFDPNYGLFVFKDQKSFLTWSSHLLLDYVKDKEECNFWAMRVAGQPKNASPTIPRFQNELKSENEKKTDNFHEFLKEVLNNPVWEKRGKAAFGTKVPDGISKCKQILQNPHISKEEAITAINLICMKKQKEHEKRSSQATGLFSKSPPDKKVTEFYEITAKVYKNWLNGEYLDHKTHKTSCNFSDDLTYHINRLTQASAAPSKPFKMCK